MSRERQLGITEPTGDLEIESVQATEQLGRLFEYELSLFSHNEAVNIDKILGQNVTVLLETLGGEDRYFNGYVSRFSQVGRNEAGYATYEASLRPWLWFLTRTADCRIFQEKKVPDIIKEICKEEGFTDIDDKLSGSYRTWVYCVQYRETDYNFISRLMEQEGIYYYFRHEDGKHTLVLCDAPGSHESIGDPIPWRPPGSEALGREACISEWLLTREVKPGAFALNDYDAEKPKASLQARSLVKRNHAASEYEIYDYPGEYLESSDGDQYAGVRIEELHSGFEEVSGNSDSRLMTTGGLFKMEQYPREDQNREYLAVSVNYELSSDVHATGASSNAPVFNCWFRAIDSKTQFRTPRTTPKPVIQGPQTAVVTGPSGEEIYPDKYGRIKVQFHWDRYGKKDENSSCWIRVAHLWAGKGWGGQHIPRIGQEVMVEFLEGDPDQPIITGRVYNADNMPPYELPGNKTQSGIKSRSTKGGGNDNFNEIRFEDKIGEEELFIQAEKDETINVKNNKTETVGADETITIGNDRKETVKGNETLTVVKDRERTVTGNETINVAKTRTHNVTINESINIGAAQEIVVGGFQAIEVGGLQNIDVGANQTMGVGRNQDIDVGKKRSVTIGTDDDLKVEKNMVIDVGDQITIKCGKASITMKKDGTVSIEGKDLTLKASGKIGVKASQDVKIKGSKVQAN